MQKTNIYWQQENRGETAIDEAKTAVLWAKSEPRYYVRLIANQIKGFKDITIYVFRRDMPKEDIARLIVLAPDRTVEDVMSWFGLTNIEDTFSKAEVKELYAYFKQFDDLRFKARRAAPPDNHSMGIEGMPIGGLQDCYDFSKETGYSLSFEAHGYFDLREAIYRDKENE